MWATSRVLVDGAAIASDVRASSFLEQKTRWNVVRDILTTLVFCAKTKDEDGPSKRENGSDFHPVKECKWLQDFRYASLNGPAGIGEVVSPIKMSCK
ncbi:hypothetical protein AVEN_26728-1 [Araneus ventricosus]|uniref:Uncharacterized protein n=1 Tax=Araneus ventricosus TaxID=182803 RepID=A0A4Y2IM50_ARAVE|nr:hypothetical protein AVEN_26728-1 [Araneus ventricosus]